VPQAVLEDSGELDIIYTGPLVRAQRADIAQGVARWVASLAELGEVAPEVLDIPDWDEIARELGSLEGVPAKLMNSKKVIKQKRDDREEAQEEMQQGMEDEQVGKGRKELAEAETALRSVPDAGQPAA
jgi:hypothetical protein